MPRQLIKLPEFHWTDQTWQTEPLTNAIKDYTHQREKQRQFDVTKEEQARQHDATNAIRQGQLDVQRQRYGREDEDRKTQEYATLAQHIVDEPNQDVGKGMWGKVLNSHPKFGEMLTKYGVDPKDHITGAKFLIGLAQGVQDPQKKALIEAQTATQRAYGESAEALRDERRQSTLNMQREQFGDEKPALDEAGGLVMRPLVHKAGLRFPSGVQPPPGTFREVEPAQAQVPGTIVERGGRLSKDQQRQQTVQELDPAIKGERLPSEAEIQRYWSAVYGQKPPSGSKYTRDGGFANVGPRNSAGDKTRDAIKGALDSAQDNISDAREVLRGTNVFQRYGSYAFDTGVAAMVQGPIRIAIRGILHGISGAQINVPEQAEYMDAMLPKPGDFINRIEFKLNHLENTLKHIQRIQGSATEEEVLAVRNAMRKSLSLKPLSAEDAKKRLDSRGGATKDGWKIERVQ
jgi:hypothetical protein